MEGAMAATQIALRGLAGIAALVHVVWLSSGFPEAASVILIPFVAAATIGAMTAAPRQPSSHRRQLHLRVPRIHGHQLRHRRCGLCHRSMTESGSMWVCSSCDQQGAAVVDPAAS